jgi:hypothetical protein
MILYYGLLPPKNELIKVQNASDVITVLSRSPSITKSYQTGTYTKGKGNDLQEGLINDGLEEELVIDDPEIVFEEPLDVNYYRTTTGMVKMLLMTTQMMVVVATMMRMIVMMMVMRMMMVIRMRMIVTMRMTQIMMMMIVIRMR